jgi:hypothetical protein
MEFPKRDEVAEGTVNQSRREALKRFGRYAAAVPTAMVLLQPRDSFAGKGKGKGKGKGRSRDIGGGLFRKNGTRRQPDRGRGGGY